MSEPTVIVGMGEPTVIVEGEDVQPDVVISFGTPGPAGMSAFQLAKSLGYTGTLAEWLGADKKYAEELAAAQTAALTDHVNADEPHPVYDGMPDLSLIFNNALI